MPHVRARVALLTGAVLLLAGCTTSPPAGRTTTPGPTAPAEGSGSGGNTALPDAHTVVVAGANAAELAVATSQALYAHAAAVVLVAAGDDAGMQRATTVAVDLGVPLLLTPASAGSDSALRTELVRLTPDTLLAVGQAADSWARTGDLSATAGPPPSIQTLSIESVGDTGLPTVEPSAPLSQLLVLARKGSTSAAAVATATAAGARTLLVDHPDPRTSDDVIKALSGQPVTRILAVGSEFGPADRLRHRVDTAATGKLLPGGGQVVFPARRMVALYGHPDAAVLGVLGEQPVDKSVDRARELAAGYSSASKTPVIPAFEIIATVAAADAGPDGNYSNESPLSLLKPWVDAARENGIYVILDLQPGRSDFLSQAKLYESLLLEPHVGLALDPEWRMQPNQVPMQVIGSVTAAEINETAAWLNDLTRRHHLPQKVLMLHQFTLDMISDRSDVDTSYDNLSTVIHADGFGSADEKMHTWNTLHTEPPANVWWGWKNFYDEDKPTFTPSQTLTVSPAPMFISYQ